MKRFISLLLVCVFVLGCAFSLASCSKATESYANKINKAAEKDKHYTYEKVMKDLGDEAIDLTFGTGVGTVMAVKGCSEWADIEEKLKNDATVKGIVIVFDLKKEAIKAEYREINENDKK
ncbi:MAG: hypothetical protein E7673_01370 [Ruminococcaceae bacterium]|nr:hypothetical protein [Oscillospiraceae bacterium]